MAIVKISDEKDFEKQVINSEGRVMVDFYADWCGPCKMMSEVIEKVSAEKPELKICKINIDDNRDVASRYDVMSIPTVMVFQNGTQVSKSIGSKTKSRLIQELGI